MILRFGPTATLQERADVEARLRSARIRAVPSEGALLLRGTLTEPQLANIATMPGVASLAPSGREYTSLRVAALGWVSAACMILGLLTLLAANLPAPLGVPADPLRTPETLQSSWPLLPIQGLVEWGPDWLPVSLLPAMAVILVIVWPLLARRLAERSPRLHVVIGVLGLGLATTLALLAVLG